MTKEITLNQMQEALKDYCDHVNNLRKIPDVKEKLQICNLYLEQQRNKYEVRKNNEV
jgi:hypothetical protein